MLNDGAALDTGQADEPAAHGRLPVPGKAPSGTVGMPFRPPFNYPDQPDQPDQPD
jgi:hypothetical protein